MTTLVLKDGRLIDGNGDRTADVVIDQATGLIAGVGRGLAADHEIDCEGFVVSPGFVDLHVHLREPGLEAAETILTGSRAAARGGFTGVVAMPNTTPTTDSVAVVEQVIAAGRDALCEVVPSAAISVDRKGDQLSPMAELMAAGVRIFTDDGNGVQDAKFMRSALEYAGGLPDHGRRVVLAQHCEVEALSKGGVMNEGEWSARLGLGGQPSEAEDLMVMRDIALARLTGVHVHFQHVSTAGAVAMVRAAKAGGLSVTAEATPHHFSLTEESCRGFDPVFKVHPPLRTDADREAVKEGLRDGTIDAIATDHAPHTPESKERSFDEAPPGMLGLETAFALSMVELQMPLPELLSLFTDRPARIAGITQTQGLALAEGRPANVTVLDLDHQWHVKGREFASLASNTPFEGRTLQGKARHTFFNGEQVVADFEVAR
ncbi:MAG: dihydroorotase [Acidimicrobiales bacterium]